MIVVRVELWSAVTGNRTEIARCVIDNIGGTAYRGDYRVRAMRGRDEDTLQQSMMNIIKGQTKPPHEGEVRNHARLAEHVWNLVAKGLTAMGYGRNG